MKIIKYTTYTTLYNKNSFQYNKHKQLLVKSKQIKDESEDNEVDGISILFYHLICCDIR
jgi:hypothetical protein